jgi:hypothetical protein
MTLSIVEGNTTKIFHLSPSKAPSRTSYAAYLAKKHLGGDIFLLAIAIAKKWIWFWWTTIVGACPNYILLPLGKWCGPWEVSNIAFIEMENRHCPA